MVEIREVKTKKEQRVFLNFPLNLYRDNDCFAPPLYMDEKKIFRKDYVYYDTCEAVYYLALREGRPVGRISGILQKAGNQKTGEKRVRFTRFDSVDDQEVARALFSAVETWARSKGMDSVCGPLGFSDLEREGLLIDGFDQLSTFEEQYNAEYYGRLIENCGYRKEVDWVESRVFLPQDDEAALEKLTSLEEYVMKRYKLHFGQAKNTREFIDLYADRFFELLDTAYAGIYGTVPFTAGMKKMMIDNFRLIVDVKYVAVILDENENIVCLGICFPSLSKAVQKSRGRLTPPALLRLLKAIRHPKTIDLGLVGVAPEYLSRGINAAICAELMKMMKRDGIEYAETNLNLEDNHAVRGQWKRFRSIEHKRRRSYLKKLTED